jgi:hypothetical protein
VGNLGNPKRFELGSSDRQESAIGLSFASPRLGVRPTAGLERTTEQHLLQFVVNNAKQTPDGPGRGCRPQMVFELGDASFFLNLPKSRDMFRLHQKLQRNLPLGSRSLDEYGIQRCEHPYVPSSIQTREPFVYWTNLEHNLAIISWQSKNTIVEKYRPYDHVLT